MSRFKFWGTPLPVWKCSCGEEKVVGSFKELIIESTDASKALINKSIIVDENFDPHKPFIDEIKLKCSKCKGEMFRVLDVIDCWYDSGAASFAQFHYPFENKELFEKNFPYNFIAEAIDQTRGWFYTLHVLGVLLFNSKAYKNVICAGHVVDEKGEKMSKSKGNIIKPDETIEQSGVDSIRLQFCTTNPGEPKRFSYNLMAESVIPFLTILYNCNNYYKQLESKKLKPQVEDKWILSKLNSLIDKVTKELENYSIDKAFLKISDFVTNDFSRGYIKITRDREDTKEIVSEILEKVSLLLAPFAPYITEYIYQNFSKSSVHLSKWPEIQRKKIDKKLESKFFYVLQVIEKGLMERDKSGIGLRWPLAKAKYYHAVKLEKKLEEIVKTQLNIKNLEFKHILGAGNWKVDLDTKTTPELEAEGYARELSRQVQAFRKKLGLEKKDKVELIIETSKSFSEVLKSQGKFIQERTNSKKLHIIPENVTTIRGEKLSKRSQFEERFKNKIDFQIKDKRGKIVIITK